MGPLGEFQPPQGEMVHHAIGSAGLAKQPKHQGNGSAHFRIGAKHDTLLSVVDRLNGKGMWSSPRLVVVQKNK